MNKNDIFVNHMNNTIYVTAKFINQAGVPGTSEYDLFRTLKMENPKYKIERRMVSKSKKVYKGLSIERMREFVALKAGEKMEAFENVCKEAKVRGHAYPRVKSWFIANFKDYAADPEWPVKAAEDEKSDEEIPAA